MSPKQRNQARLRHTSLGVLVLPYWPEEVSHEMRVRSWSELERPGKRPLTIPGSIVNDSYSFGYIARNANLYQSVRAHLTLLQRMSRSKSPVTLWLGRANRGAFHIESASITELEWAPNGDPSVADVSLTLRAASDVTIQVGRIKRKKNKKPKNTKKS